MVDISIRGELWDDDSADILRWWGFRDITAPMDIRSALEAAGGDEVTAVSYTHLTLPTICSV